ncbi:hypothetical protein NLJ89_g4119 [Agrocybe chaxingu]|uniref:C2 domain-containing protein n=1 Tax=Agrocybe chaxingu TaxID=84603 RepID=A0A9W8K3B8_9AGAR|nr:hypothetical protein NLJ89_g4119 [Agrocybe chaxingu]
MASVDPTCAGISSNPDISGPGVRIALYLQSLLSVILVRVSPKDAPGAYWSMTSTAISLIISSVITSAQRKISLLDAIVVVYVLLLPVLTSAFGLSEMLEPSQRKSSTHLVHSPLLIIANWMRSALTYAFALYVWISAPTLGSGPPECNEATRLIFFGASLPALGSGRFLSLAVWGVATVLFVKRTIKGSMTISIAFRALFSDTASQALLQPKERPKNEVLQECVTVVDFATGDTTDTSRFLQPRQIFYGIIKGVTDRILSWVPSGTDRWYRLYGRTALISLLASCAIIMTELELLLNKLEILPLLLTISPLLSLYESILSRSSTGPTTETRLIRFYIRRAKGLQRPRTEFDAYLPEIIDRLPEVLRKAQTPSPFAVITIDEREMYTSRAEESTCDPEWDESFDVRVGNLSTIVIRVFDHKCVDLGLPGFIGFATLLPFALMPPPTKEGEQGIQEAHVKDIPLVREGRTVPSMTVSISLSTDTRVPPGLPAVPQAVELQEMHIRRRVAMAQLGDRRWGRKKDTRTYVYNVPDQNALDFKL